MRMLYILHKVFVYFVKIGCEFFCSGGSIRCRSRSGFGKETKMETIVDEERRHLGGFLGSVVVYEFCKWKQFELVILFVIAKDAEVGF